MDKRVILFQGDSITDASRNRTVERKNCSLGDGYVTMLAGQLSYEHPGIEIINRGVSGNRIADTYGRWQEDALNIKYDLLSILTGINDVGFGIRMGKGSDTERFECIYDRMLFEVTEKNPEGKIVLCQPFVLKMDLSSCVPSAEFCNDIYTDWNVWSSDMERRVEVVIKLSEKYHTMYAPLWDALREAQKRIPVENLTFDCIHLTATGNYVIAQEWKRVTKPFFERN